MPSNKRSSVREELSEFCSQTNFLPASIVYQSSNWLRSLAIIVLSLAMTSFMIYQIVTLVTKYYSFPVQVEIELMRSKEQDFPSITICNLNPIRMEYVEDDILIKNLNDVRDDGRLDALFQNTEFTISSFMKQLSKTSIGIEDDKLNIKVAGKKISLKLGGKNKNKDDETTQAIRNFTSEITTPDTATQATFGENSPTTNVANISSNTTQSVATDTASNFALELNTTTTLVPTTTKKKKKKKKKGLFGRRKRETEPLEPTMEVDESHQTFMANNTFNQWKNGLSSLNTTYYQTVTGPNKAFADVVEQMDPLELASYAHQLNDMLINCRFQGYSCSPMNFTAVENNKYGRCYTFNPLVKDGNFVPILKTQNSGHIYGLALELFIEQESYTPGLSPGAGFRVLVHTRGEMPFPEDEGFTISAGQATSAGIRKTVTIRLPPPHGICVNSSQGTLYSQKYNVAYSRSACQKSCLQNKIIASCGCAFAKYIVPDGQNRRVCRGTQMTCARNYENLFKSDVINCDEICPVSCKETRYDLTMSTSYWPSRNSKADVEQRMTRASNKVNDAWRKHRIKSNVAKLEVYFTDLNYIKVEQKEAYGIDSLISDLGGQLGLYMGISLLVIAELMNLAVNITMILSRKIAYKYNHDKRAISADNAGDIPVEEVKSVPKENPEPDKMSIAPSVATAF